MKEQIAEGKTKVIYSLSDEPHLVEIVSKDRITAGDGARAHDMVGKAVISTATTSKVFELLNKAGIRTHFVKQNGENSFVARKCAMVPIEWVARRIATGSFLKRNPGVKEGHRFSPLKLETFFKDDANHDPQWSREQLIAAELKVGGVTIGRHEVDIMSQTTITVFEILEKAWASLNCTLVDMKIEFGVDPSFASAEPHNLAAAILLADVIDADSWRLWPSGDRRLMKDKQVYRELKEVTGEALEQVKLNFQWIADKLKELTPDVNGRAVVLMGSPADVDHCQKIKKGCESFGIPCTLRVSSAHKSVGDTLQIASDYESDGIPTVIIAVAGRSNGLGPVLSGHTTFPVINCPPVTADWGSHEIWSSLRLPSGLGCSTVLSPEAATLSVAQIIGLTNHTVWAKLRAQQLNQRISLEEADRKFQAL